MSQLRLFSRLSRRRHNHSSGVSRIFLLVIMCCVAATLTFFLSTLNFFAVSAKSSQSDTSGNGKTEFYEGREVAAGEVLVKFNHLAGAAAVTTAKQDADVDLDEGVGGQGVRLFRSRSKNTGSLVQQLSQRADVVYVEPNYIIHVDATPNDPRYSELYGLHNPNNPGKDISAKILVLRSPGTYQKGAHIFSSVIADPQSSDLPHLSRLSTNSKQQSAKAVRVHKRRGAAARRGSLARRVSSHRVDWAFSMPL